MASQNKSAFITHIQPELEAKAKSIKQLINQQEPDMNFTTDVACGMLCDLPKECDNPCSWIQFMTERNLVSVDDALAIVKKVLEVQKP